MKTLSAAIALVTITGCGVEENLSAKEAALQAGGLLPDIVEEVPNHLNMVNQQQREWLRFTSTHWNVAQSRGSLRIRGGGQIAPCTVDGVAYDQCTYAMQEIVNSAGEVVAENPAGVAVFHVEHNHWHQNNVADFLLRAGSLTGPVVSQATKVTYCLIDWDWSRLVDERTKPEFWECGAEYQGISYGFGDSYHHATHGQELDITKVPSGTYYLTHDADPANHWLEERDDNNASWTKFALTRKGANPEVTILDTSCDETSTDPVEEIICGNTRNK